MLETIMLWSTVYTFFRITKGCLWAYKLFCEDRDGNSGRCARHWSEDY